MFIRSPILYLCGTAVPCLLESSGLLAFSKGRKIYIWPHMALTSIKFCTGNVRCGTARCGVVCGVMCVVVWCAAWCVLVWCDVRFGVGVRCGVVWCAIYATLCTMRYGRSVAPGMALSI